MEGFVSCVVVTLGSDYFLVAKLQLGLAGAPLKIHDYWRRLADDNPKDASSGCWFSETGQPPNGRSRPVLGLARLVGYAGRILSGRFAGSRALEGSSDPTGPLGDGAGAIALGERARREFLAAEPVRGPPPPPRW